MESALTVRLTKSESRSLDRICRETGKTRSELVRASLRSFRLRHALQTSHEHFAPVARVQGWLTEDDVLSASE